ncbi:MAG: hypothetical protein WDN29_01115 [Methylovirgula sp.]
MIERFLRCRCNALVHLVGMRRKGRRRIFKDRRNPGAGFFQLLRDLSNDVLAAAAQLRIRIGELLAQTL